MNSINRKLFVLFCLAIWTKNWNPSLSPNTSIQMNHKEIVWLDTMCNMWVEVWNSWISHHRTTLQAKTINQSHHNDKHQKDMNSHYCINMNYIIVLQILPSVHKVDQRFFIYKAITKHPKKPPAPPPPPKKKKKKKS